MQDNKPKIQVESNYAQINNYGKFDREDFFKLFQKALNKVCPEHVNLLTELNISSDVPSIVRLYVDKPYILISVDEKQLGFSIKFEKLVHLFQILINEVSSEKHNLDYLVRMIFDMAKEQEETLVYCTKTNQLTYFKGE